MKSFVPKRPIKTQDSLLELVFLGHLGQDREVLLLRCFQMWSCLEMYGNKLHENQVVGE